MLRKYTNLTCPKLREVPKEPDDLIERSFLDNENSDLILSTEGKKMVNGFERKIEGIVRQTTSAVEK